MLTETAFYIIVEVDPHLATALETNLEIVRAMVELVANELGRS